MVVSLHDVNLARERFGRLIGLKAGLLQFDLPTAEVTEDRLRELYGEEFGMAVANFGLPDADNSKPNIIVTGCG
jgi:ABC-type phosphate/phosphonate transport system ATPase subunit